MFFDFQNFVLCSKNNNFEQDYYAQILIPNLDEQIYDIKAQTNNNFNIIYNKNKIEVLLLLMANIDLEKNKYNDKIYDTDELEELFMNDGEVNDINKFNDIYKMSICNSNTDKKLNFQKLKLLDNLKMLEYNNTRLIKIPEEFFELKNLTHLSISILGLYEKNPIYNLSGFANLNNLLSLSLCIVTKEFPKEILQLKQLRILNLATFFELKISDEICNLEYLFHFSITPSKLEEIYTYKNKAMITHIDYLEYINYVANNEITDLKILDCGMKDLVDLPDNLEILRLGKNIKKLTNLPIGLKKLYIDNLFRTYNEENIKLPFGCELIFIIY